MSHVLQKLYDLCGMIAGGLILCICVLISMQICLNAFGRLAPGLLPSTIPSYADFSGFMLAGATFLAMAHTLRSGGHIRVNLVVSRLPSKVQVASEIFALVMAIGLVGYAGLFMIMLVAESLHYGDVSNGIIPVPLWFPQTVAAFGMGLLFVALVHTLIDLLHARRPILSQPGDL